MVEGSALLTTMFHELIASGGHDERRRGTNVLDGGAPYYDVYETADARWFAVGAVEPQFYAELLDGLGLDQEDLPDRSDKTQWPELRARLAAAFRSRTRDEWTVVFDGTDACATPVLLPSECPDHSPIKLHRGRWCFSTSAGTAIVPHARSRGRAPGGSMGPSGEYRPGSAWPITRCRSTTSSTSCIYLRIAIERTERHNALDLRIFEHFSLSASSLHRRDLLSTGASRCRWHRECAPDPRHTRCY